MKLRTTLARIALGAGLTAIFAVSVAASYLSGVYGSLGPHGAAIAVSIIVLLAALVAYPAWYLRSRRLATLLAGYAALLAVSCASVHAALYLDPSAEPTSTRIVSMWRAGQRIDQAVVNGDATGTLDNLCDGCTRIVERIVDEGPLPSLHPVLFALSIVAGRDGIAIEQGEHTRYLTPADLLSQQTSRGNPRFGFLKHRLGLDDPRATLDLLQGNSYRRFIVTREDAAAKLWPKPIRSEDVNLDKLKGSIAANAHYLARNQHEDGRFLYELDPIRGEDTGGYNMPRHSGATLLLAEAARYLSDVTLRDAAMRGARFIQATTSKCGEYDCIGKGPRTDIGAAALAVLAYVELARDGASELRPDIERLTAFIRSLQREDGEYMHVYDRKAGRPIDRQLPYYTGEAALALARAHVITKDPRDLDSAQRAISYLVTRGFHVFGRRFVFDPEHWTCQALDELWDHTHDRTALQFCLDYQARNRRQQFGADNEIGPYEGGFGPNPFFPPRLTAAGSRSEAAVATLATAARAGVDRDEQAAIEEQIRRSLAYLMRMQFTPGPTYLFADPDKAFGGTPGSPTDLRVRIDLPQHAASGMIRYARLLEGRALRSARVQ